MRRFLTVTGTALLAVALLMGGTPAQAGELSWADEVDEPGTAAQATLDIAKVTLSFDGTTFKTVLDIKGLGDPAPFGTGQFFALDFSFGEADYTLRVTQDRVVGDKFQFQSSELAPGGNSRTVTTIPCRTCKFELDRAGSKVLMQIGWESLTSAARKLAPGKSIEALEASTGSSYSLPDTSGTGVINGGTFLWYGNPGDSSAHPDGEPFTF